MQHPHETSAEGSEQPMMCPELNRQPAHSLTGGTGIAGGTPTATAPTHTWGCCHHVHSATVP